MKKSLEGEWSRSFSQVSNGNINEFPEKRDFLVDVSKVVFPKIYCNNYSIAQPEMEEFNYKIIVMEMSFEHTMCTWYPPLR